jgi:aminomethyltransferase
MTRYPVRAAGQALGHVTSALYSPRLAKNIGYALVPATWSPVGTKLEVNTPAGMRAATVVPMPFVDPKKTLAKS